MIYGISDLHLDHTGSKSMEVFGEAWKDYENRIFTNWKDMISDDDIVLIPGDISWAMKIDDVIYDLKRIDSLPGTKILLKGNHDYWWQSLKKLKSLRLESLLFLQNNSYFLGGYNIVGSRAWLARDNSSFTEEDEPIFKRELIRLKLSLDSISDEAPIIAMLHYPPFDRYKNPNEFGQLLKEYDVEKCIYGHLHSEGLSAVVEGQIDGIEYTCLSADYIDFKPVLIGE
ncbi:MAG: metallophosphoesterase [Tissierellia bacterium]|nr:metallophosphoesterase [Tissierellia bacterium]